ncbi:hypothetical protein JW758_01630 [Candidatus Peregrinibacteria bacterium]|nr:hypothetical protein [Candidatus Peregrinibacteria bacterium]
MVKRNCESRGKNEVEEVTEFILNFLCSLEGKTTDNLLTLSDGTKVTITRTFPGDFVNESDVVAECDRASFYVRAQLIPQIENMLDAGESFSIPTVLNDEILILVVQIKSPSEIPSSTRKKTRARVRRLF